MHAAWKQCPQFVRRVALVTISWQMEQTVASVITAFRAVPAATWAVEGVIGTALSNQVVLPFCAVVSVTVTTFRFLAVTCERRISSIVALLR
jgi:hypothetical protein